MGAGYVHSLWPAMDKANVQCPLALVGNLVVLQSPAVSRDERHWPLGCPSAVPGRLGVIPMIKGHSDRGHHPTPADLPKSVSSPHPE